MDTLRTVLSDWTDLDLAQHELATMLGIVDENTDFTEVKWIYWTNNPVGEALYGVIATLVRSGVLESREEEGLSDYQVRWAPDFHLPEA